MDISTLVHSAIPALTLVKSRDLGDSLPSSPSLLLFQAKVFPPCVTTGASKRRQVAQSSILLLWQYMDSQERMMTYRLTDLDLELLGETSIAESNVNTHNKHHRGARSKPNNTEASTDSVILGESDHQVMTVSTVSTVIMHHSSYVD